MPTSSGIQSQIASIDGTGLITPVTISGGSGGGTVVSGGGTGVVLIDPTTGGTGTTTTLPGGISPVVTPNSPGDLGTMFEDFNTYLLKLESWRDSSTFNGYFPVNSRYRGHREANKFNLTIQSVLCNAANLFYAMKSWYDGLTTAETQSVYISNAAISEINHCIVQMRFTEFMMIKNQNVNWYVF